MFKSAEQYNNNNRLQQDIVREQLEKYIHHIKFGKEILALDIGCGSGSVTAEVLVSFIPHPYFKLIGVDKLQHMVDFANNNVKDPRITFHVLDIKEKNTNKLMSVITKEKLHSGFDLIFSFNCLHWTFDYKQSFQNIFTLMKPGGQVLVNTATFMTISEVWLNIHKHEKWHQLLKVKPAFSLQYHENPDAATLELKQLLTEIGFHDIICYREWKEFVPKNSPHDYRKMMENGDPYLSIIPEHLHSEYMDDLMYIFNEQMEKTPTMPYDMIIIVATKPLNDIHDFY